MSYNNGPKIVTDGLQLYLDAGNNKSYIGSGTSWRDLTENSDTFASSYYTYPSPVVSNNVRGFNFINNGTTVNNIYNASPTLNTRVQTSYTRMAWFNLQTNPTEWSPIIQNQIGNNSDMGLAIAPGNYIHFRQYTKSQTNGTADGDYGVSSTGTIDTNCWNSAAIVVNLTAKTVSFYINGIFSSISNLNTIGVASNNTIIVGGAAVDNYSGGRMFKGYISTVMHYGRLLNPEEISQNHNLLKSRFNL